MPIVRKLSPEEVQTIEHTGKGRRKIIEEQYDRLLEDFAIGEYGEAALDADEQRLTVRNRLKAAATRRGVTLDLKRTSGPFIRFKVSQATDRLRPCPRHNPSRRRRRLPPRRSAPAAARKRPAPEQ